MLLKLGVSFAIMLNFFKAQRVDITPFDLQLWLSLFLYLTISMRNLTLISVPHHGENVVKLYI